VNTAMLDKYDLSKDIERNGETFSGCRGLPCYWTIGAKKFSKDLFLTYRAKNDRSLIGNRSIFLRPGTRPQTMRLLGQAGSRAVAQNCCLWICPFPFAGGLENLHGDRAASGAPLDTAGGKPLVPPPEVPSLGAAADAGGGAVIGATADPCDLDLGDPVWRNHGGRQAYECRCRHSPMD